MTACTVLIYSERSFLSPACIAFCNAFLCSPENCFIKYMRFRDILEWGIRNCFWCRFSLDPPEEHHALTSGHFPIHTKCPITIALCYSFLICPEYCFVKRMIFRNIAERGLRCVDRRLNSIGNGRILINHHFLGAAYLIKFRL